MQQLKVSFKAINNGTNW